MKLKVERKKRDVTMFSGLSEGDCFIGIEEECPGRVVYMVIPQTSKRQRDNATVIAVDEHGPAKLSYAVGDVLQFDKFDKVDRVEMTEATFTILE